MTRDEVAGTIKSMANKYSRPRIITKNHVVAGKWRARLCIRFYEDGFMLRNVNKCHVLDRAYIKYESVNKLIQSMNVLYIDGEDFTMYINF